MARKLADIASFIHHSTNKFKTHLSDTLDEEVLIFLQQLSQQCTIYLFSGIIRDFFLKKNNARDIDLFIDGNVNLESLLKEKEYKKNSFGGYKIRINNTDIDLWFLEETWAIKNNQLVMDFDLAKYIPYTAFFNFSSIMYAYTEEKFYFTKHFLRFLRDRKMDIVFLANPNQALCVVNSMYYSNKYKLTMSDKLKRFLKKIYPLYIKQYEAVQEKHFGEVLYTVEEIGERIYNS